MTTDAAATEQPEAISVEAELQLILDRATPKQREWLEALPSHSWQYYGTGEALSLSSHTIWKWLLQEDIRRYLDLCKTRVADRIGFNEMSVATAWQRDVKCDIRKFFTDTGTIKPPQEWPAEFVDCVTEYGTNAHGERFIKFADKRGALDRQAKFLKMLVDRTELTGADGQPLQYQAPVIVIGGPEEPDEPGAKG